LQTVQRTNRTSAHKDPSICWESSGCDWPTRGGISGIQPQAANQKHAFRPGRFGCDIRTSPVWC
jgi:hypothetical protein